MEKHRVLLLSAHPLLSEGLGNLLSTLEDVILIGPRDLGSFALTDLVADAPDAVLFAGQEDDYATINSLMIEIWKHYPDLPVIQVGLAANDANHIVRVYTSHTLPARSADLIETIRSLPIQQQGGTVEDTEET